MDKLASPIEGISYFSESAAPRVGFFSFAWREWQAIHLREGEKSWPGDPDQTARE